MLRVHEALGSTPSVPPNSSHLHSCEPKKAKNEEMRPNKGKGRPSIGGTERESYKTPAAKRKKAGEEMVGWGKAGDWKEIEKRRSCW